MYWPYQIRPWTNCVEVNLCLQNVFHSMHKLSASLHLGYLPQCTPGVAIIVIEVWTLDHLPPGGIIMA